MDKRVALGSFLTDGAKDLTYPFVQDLHPRARASPRSELALTRYRGETVLRLPDGVPLSAASFSGEGVDVAEAPRQTTAQRLNELRRAHPHDATLQNLIELLSAKLDLSARLPVFEYEADSEGFSETASFLSALASAERESVQDLLASLRRHLDRTHGRFTPGVPS